MNTNFQSIDAKIWCWKSWIGAGSFEYLPYVLKTQIERRRICINTYIARWSMRISVLYWLISIFQKWQIISNISSDEPYIILSARLNPVECSKELMPRPSTAHLVGHFSRSWLRHKAVNRLRHATVSSLRHAAVNPLQRDSENLFNTKWLE